MNYILDEDKNVVGPVEVLDWSEWLEDLPNRRVRNECGTDANGDRKVVSTVFLGIDHAFGDGPPEVFETMVFPADADDSVASWSEVECRRCSTWNEAVEQHENLVAELGLTDLTSYGEGDD